MLAVPASETQIAAVVIDETTALAEAPAKTLPIKVPPEVTLAATTADVGAEAAMMTAVTPAATGTATITVVAQGDLTLALAHLRANTVAVMGGIVEIAVTEVTDRTSATAEVENQLTERRR